MTTVVTADPEKRVRKLEADVLALEEAMDSSRDDRALLRKDLDTVTVVLTALIRKLDDERRDSTDD